MKKLGYLAIPLSLALGCGKTTTGEDMAPGPADMRAGGADMASAAQPIDYYQGAASAALGAQGNQATCATCHSNDGSARSGQTFKDIAYHTSFKGGMAAKLIDATNACVTGWMGGKALTDKDEAWLKLESYLQSISDKAKTTPNPIQPEVLANEAAYQTAYAGGTAATGAAKYAKACGVCHDTQLTVGSSKALAKGSLKGFSIGRLAQQVRTSGPPPSGTMDASDSTPGPMPFFEPADLSKADLQDIIAHIKAQ